MAEDPRYPGSGIPAPPPQYVSAGKGIAINPAYSDWENQYGQAMANQDAMQAQRVQQAEASRPIIPNVPAPPPQWMSQNNALFGVLPVEKDNPAYAAWQSRYAADYASNQRRQQAIDAAQAQAFQEQARVAEAQRQAEIAAAIRADPTRKFPDLSQSGTFNGNDNGKWSGPGETGPAYGYADALHTYTPYRQDPKNPAKWYNVSRTGTNEGAVAGVHAVFNPIDHLWYWQSGDGANLGPAVAKKGASVNLANLGGAGTGPTWYQQQQVLLDHQRIKDAEQAQKWQEAQSVLQKQEAASNAQQASNQSFKAAQLQSTYGSITNADSGVPQAAPAGGFTGAGYPMTPIPDQSTQPAAPQTQAPIPVKGMAAGGTVTTWYEQQQIALDKKRLADARAAQAWQEAQALQQKRAMEGQAIDTANQTYRDDKLKSYYGTVNGMAYGAPKGARVVQKLPEPMLLAQGYKDLKQTNPWTAPITYGGYTGSTYMNSQQPGLYSLTDPSMAIPTSGPGSSIPTPAPKTLDPYSVVSHAGGGDVPMSPGGDPGGQVPGGPGQPQLIMAHGGEHITPAPGTPLPTLLGSPGGKPFSNPLDPSDPNNPSDSSGTSINDLVSNLISAAQALVTNPGFAKLGIPIAPMSQPTDGASPDGGGGPPPGMAMGGTVGSRDSANQSPFALTSLRDSAQQSLAPSPFNISGPRGIPDYMPTSTNAYGQTVSANTAHAPGYNDIIAGKGVLNHMPYSPVLTGLSGYGATMTADGTPVVMSNWQRSHLMPNSISGPGGYDDYAMQVAGWNPADLQALGNNMTGDFGTTGLSAPKNYSPISINPAPSGG